MKKVERLIALLYLLKRRRGLHIKDIARELGTTERTVYRDIASLNEAFQDYVQIICNPDGYYLDSTIYAPPLRLAVQELEALNEKYFRVEGGFKILSNKLAWIKDQKILIKEFILENLSIKTKAPMLETGNFSGA